MAKASFVAFLVTTVIAFTEAQLPKLPISSNLDPLNSDILSKPVDWFLFELIPRLIDQKPASKIPDKNEYREYMMKDVSNDDARHLSTVSQINPSQVYCKLMKPI